MNKLFNKTGLLTSGKDRTQQTFDSLMPRTPLMEIFFGINTLRLGGLQLMCLSLNMNYDVSYLILKTIIKKLVLFIKI